MGVVPFYQGEQHFIRLPKDKVATFVSNEEQIYAYVKYDTQFRATSSRLAVKYAPKAKPAAAKPAAVDNGDFEFYKVRKGDNLGAIASKYNVSISEIKKWNNLKTNAVAIGRSLKIKADEEVPAKTIPAVDKEQAIASAENKEKTAVDMDYVVVAGDNLGSIAKKFGTTIAELKELNNLTSNNIGLGKTIIISKAAVVIEEPVSTAIASNSVDTFKKKAPSKNVSEDYYVKKGDSLYSISKKYPGVTISDIKKWNGIKDEDIKPGMKLKING